MIWGVDYPKFTSFTVVSFLSIISLWQVCMSEKASDLSLAAYYLCSSGQMTCLHLTFLTCEMHVVMPDLFVWIIGKKAGWTERMEPAF